MTLGTEVARRGELRVKSGAEMLIATASVG